MMEIVDGAEQHGDICSKNRTFLEVNKPGSWLGPPENSDLNFSISLGAAVSLFIKGGSWMV